MASGVRVRVRVRARARVSLAGALTRGGHFVAQGTWLG